MNLNPGIIIIGGHVQGLGITRILGKLNIPIIVLDNTSFNIARHSKYCKTFVKFENDTLLEKLVYLSKQGLYKDYIIFPTNDLHVSILSQNKDQLSKYFTLAIDNWATIEKCYNKRLTYSIAQKIKIPIADTWTPNSEEELKALKISFPVIIKPAVMHSFYSKLKTKVFVCNNQKELVSNYKLALTVIPANEVIVQSIIQGGSEHLYSACFLFNKDKEIQSFIGKRIRQHPPDFGNATTFAQIADNEELIETSKKLLTEIQYTGICEVEYKYDLASQKYLFLEINPRTWKWHSIAEKANINMLENYYLFLQNKDLKPIKKENKASFRHLITDLPTLWKYKRLGISIKSPKYPVQYAVWNKKDIMPAIFELFYLPYLILKR